MEHSLNDRVAERRAMATERLRRYSLTRMLRSQGWRRTEQGRCKCGKVISPNKTQCLACASVPENQFRLR